MKGALPRRARILACAIARANKVDVSELCEIAWVAYLGQITNIRRAKIIKGTLPGGSGY